LKALILAAGFGTRLKCELNDYLDNPAISKEEKERACLLAEDKPKGLVLVRGKTVVDHLLQQLVDAGISRGEVYLHTNARYFSQFKEWAVSRGIPHSNMINNKVEQNENRLGTIGDLKHALGVIGNRIRKDEPLIFLASDTLTYDADNNLYSFSNLVSGYVHDGVSRIVVYKGEKSRLSNHGIVESDEEGYITGFEEKPAKPKSDQVNASVHLYNPSCLRLIMDYKGKMDNHGDLIAHLIQRIKMKVEKIARREDIGGLTDVFNANR